MRSHPMSEKADHDRMSELEVRMADATNLAGVEKIPQVISRVILRQGVVNFMIRVKLVILEFTQLSFKICRTC